MVSSVWYCVSEHCKVDLWWVRQEAMIWHVWDTEGGGHWTIAADLPVCPRCGSTLSQKPVEKILEPGKMLDFLESIPY